VGERRRRGSGVAGGVRAGRERGRSGLTASRWPEIHADLTGRALDANSGTDLTQAQAQALKEHTGVMFMGASRKDRWIFQANWRGNGCYKAAIPMVGPIAMCSASLERN